MVDGALGRDNPPHYSGRSTPFQILMPQRPPTPHPAVWRAWSLTTVALGAVCLAVLLPLLPALKPGAEMIYGLDSVIHLGWEAANRKALSAGEIPHWNPYSFSGSPGLAEIQHQVFYPPNIVLRALPLTEFFSWGIVFHESVPTLVEN